MTKTSLAVDNHIAWVRVSSCYLPLATPISDAKVLTGRQKPMTEIAILFAEVETADGHQGWDSAIPSGPVGRDSSRTPRRSLRR